MHYKAKKAAAIIRNNSEEGSDINRQYICTHKDVRAYGPLFSVFLRKVRRQIVGDGLTDRQH